MFEKIFKSLDFRGNKIKNAKVEELPIDNKHIANKEYVDNQSIYDTQKSQTYLNPFKFEWITNVYNKNIKQIFDDLFFPRIFPTYQNPTCSIYSFEILGQPQQLFDKFLIFENQDFNFNLVAKLSPNDRVGVGQPILKLYNGIEETIINPTSIDGEYIHFDDITIKINADYLMFKIEQQFLSAETKQDNYGDDFIPQEFTIPFNLSYDATSNITDLLIIKPSLLFRKQTIEDFPSDENTDIINNTSIPIDFSFTNNLYFSANEKGLYGVMIPLDFLPSNKYIFEAEIYDTSGTESKLLNIVLLNPLLFEYPDIIMIDELNNEYRYHELYFGEFNHNIHVKLNYRLVYSLVSGSTLNFNWEQLQEMIDGLGDTTGKNLGSGEIIFKEKVGQEFQFKTLKGSDSILIETSDNEITLKTKFKEVSW